MFKRKGHARKSHSNSPPDSADIVEEVVLVLEEKENALSSVTIYKYWLNININIIVIQTDWTRWVILDSENNACYLTIEAIYAKIAKNKKLQ